MIFKFFMFSINYWKNVKTKRGKSAEYMKCLINFCYSNSGMLIIRFFLILCFSLPGYLWDSWNCFCYIWEHGIWRRCVVSFPCQACCWPTLIPSFVLELSTFNICLGCDTGRKYGLFVIFWIKKCINVPWMHLMFNLNAREDFHSRWLKWGCSELDQ